MTELRAHIFKVSIAPPLDKEPGDDRQKNDDDRHVYPKLACALEDLGAAPYQVFGDEPYGLKEAHLMISTICSPKRAVVVVVVV